MPNASARTGIIAAVPTHPPPRGQKRMPQVFARDTRLPEFAPLVYLGVGEAATYRGDAREGHLICPLPGCPDRRLTTRGGSRRDHFAHLASPHGTHAAETLAHHTAKHLLARAVRAVHSDANVHVDTRETEDGARPDVLVEFADGRRVAYEVQYAALTVEEWQRRHDRYVAGGIRDVWLLGGTRYQRRPRYEHYDEAVRVLGPLAVALANSGHPVLLIDPTLDERRDDNSASDDDVGRVGLAVGAGVLEALAGWPHDGDEFRVQWWPLTQARFPSGVIDLPGLRAQLAESAGRRGLVAERLERHRRMQEEADARRREAELAAAALAAARAEKEAGWLAQRAELEAIGGPLPAVIDAPRVTGEDACPAGWRWSLLTALDDALGWTVTVEKLAEACGLRFGLGSYNQTAALRAYLRVLRGGGYVWWADSLGKQPVLVLGGARSGPVRPAPDGQVRAVFPALVGCRLTEDDGTLVWSTTRHYSYHRTGRTKTRYLLRPNVAGQVHLDPLPGWGPAAEPAAIERATDG